MDSIATPLSAIQPRTAPRIAKINGIYLLGIKSKDFFMT
nr:MAG TPA: hypothetical protein [Caudoviricetes sp.]